MKISDDYYNEEIRIVNYDFSFSQVDLMFSLGHH